MHVNVLAEIIDDMILEGHVPRIVFGSNACKLFAECMDDMMLVWQLNLIKWVSNACKLFGRKHR
jgi:hypothetical protein